MTTPRATWPVLLPLLGEGYTGDRTLLGYFPSMDEAAEYCSRVEWSEAWCAVLIRADGVEVCFDGGTRPDWAWVEI